MASRLKQLQDRDAAITAEMRKMSDQLSAEDRTEFNEEESAKFDQLTCESASVQRMLKVENDILASEKRLAVKVEMNQRAAEEAADTNADKQQADSLGRIDVKRNYQLKHFRGEGRTRDEWNADAYKAGRFFLASVWKDAASAKWCAEHGMPLQSGAMLAQGENSNTGGAVLVPDVLSNVIIDLREEYGVFRRNAKTWAMSSDNLTVPRRLSGLSAYFVTDGIATTESTKGWDAVSLVAKELAALVRYPRTLAEDAIINMADDLAGEIAYAFALKEDQCGFLGDGSETYGGIRGIVTVIDDASHGNGTTTNGATAGGVQIAASGATGIGSVALADFEKVVGLLPQYAASNAKWYMSRPIWSAGPQRLMDAGGGNTNETLAGGARMTFLGFPVEISQVLNSTLGTQASTIVALFGDLSLASCLGSRREIGVDASSDRYFEYRQIAIQGVERFDINNHDLGTTSAAGPIVALKTAAS